MEDLENLINIISAETEAGANTKERIADVLQLMKDKIVLANSYNVFAPATLTGGTWLNGNKIYRKIYEGLTDAGGNFQVDVSALNIDKIVSINSFTNDGDAVYGSNFVENSGTNTTSSRANVKYSITDNLVISSNYELIGDTFNPYQNLSCIIIIEYTELPIIE